MTRQQIRFGFVRVPLARASLVRAALLLTIVGGLAAATVEWAKGQQATTPVPSSRPQPVPAKSSEQDAPAAQIRLATEKPDATTSSAKATTPPATDKPAAATATASPPTRLTIGAPSAPTSSVPSVPAAATLAAPAASAAPIATAENPPAPVIEAGKFCVELLLVKSDWSKATHGAEAKAGFEQRIKDLPIPEPLRRDVIANGYAILFSNAGLYEPARYESLVAWLALNDLLVGRIKGDSAARKAGTSHFAAVRVGDDRMPWTSNVEERPLVEQRQEIEWKVYQLDEASGGDLFGIMHRAVRATRPLGAQEFSRERLSNIETCRYTMPRDSVLVLPTLQQSENGGPASVLLRSGPPGARYRNLGSSTQQKYPDMLAEPAAVAMLSGRVEALLVIHAGVTGWPQVDSPSSPAIDVPNRVIEETPAPPASGFPLGWSGNRQPDWVDSELQENRQTTNRDRGPGRRASTNSPFSSRGALNSNDMGAVMSNGFGAGGREPIRDQAQSPATSLPAPTSVDPNSLAKSQLNSPANTPSDSARANLTFVDPVTGRASPVDPLVASGTSLKVPSDAIANGARGKERITVVGLRFLRAESVAVTLQQLFRDRASIVAEQRTNRLLVSADEAVIVELRELLDQLDRAPDASLVWRAEPTADGRVELREPRSGWTPAERQQIVQRLTEVAADADVRVKSVAKQVVDAARKVPPTDPYFKELEDQLRVAINAAFEAQDALESAQLSDFEFRIEGVKKALEFRRQNKRMVIEQRLGELKQPGEVKEPGVPKERVAEPEVIRQ